MPPIPLPFFLVFHLAGSIFLNTVSSPVRGSAGGVHELQKPTCDSVVQSTRKKETPKRPETKVLSSICVVIKPRPSNSHRYPNCPFTRSRTIDFKHRVISITIIALERRLAAGEDELRTQPQAVT